MDFERYMFNRDTRATMKLLCIDTGGSGHGEMRHLKGDDAVFHENYDRFSVPHNASNNRLYCERHYRP